MRLSLYISIYHVSFIAYLKPSCVCIFQTAMCLAMHVFSYHVFFLAHLQLACHVCYCIPEVTVLFSLHIFSYNLSFIVLLQLPCVITKVSVSVKTKFITMMDVRRNADVWMLQLITFYVFQGGRISFFQYCFVSVIQFYSYYLHMIQ